ncbi:MAG: peptidoglycan DD-metalloendopeptidase family protein [Chloroflexi bacterium]|nr:peptidoglycan DD-metalloendopeptidase family protein [Chloroflexota bacterium]
MKKKFLACASTVALAILWLAGLSQSAAQSETATPLASETSQQNPKATDVDALSSLDATATAIAAIEPTEHHLLRRPIQLDEDLVHWPDRTYPYGSTQWGTRPVHLGVEFVNPRDTPVYASGAGKVVFAGSDSETVIGPQADYYGKVVVMVHDLVSLDGYPVFTLYGHLDRINVSTGQAVEDGALLGAIGSTGVAIGAHLHYEVRVASPFDYRKTRNPELWLQYYVNNGMVAGYIHDEYGEAIAEKRLVLRSGGLSREAYTYASELVNRDPVWGENFTVADLPAGEYEIVVLKESGAIAYRDNIQVEAYTTTFVDIEISE